VRYLRRTTSSPGCASGRSSLSSSTTPSTRRSATSRSFAVLFVDLDRFKLINDTLARLGGDEFIVLLQEVANEEQVAAAARKILAAVTRPVEIAGEELYAAKESGKNAFQLYSRGMKGLS
jgi:GGDEF domain-containing protein